MPKFDREPCPVEVLKMHASSIGRLFFFARRSSDGKWANDGKSLPFLWGGRLYGSPGVAIKCGPWMTAVVIANGPRK